MRDKSGLQFCEKRSIARPEELLRTAGTKRPKLVFETLYSMDCDVHPSTASAISPNVMVR